jgi:hypothetical protein
MKWSIAICLFVASAGLLTSCAPEDRRQAEFAAAAEKGNPVPDSKWKRIDKETWRRVDTEYGIVCYRSEYGAATLSCVKIDTKEVTE